MIRVRPSFYERFSCTASRCGHNCCIGWEIDIDPETRARYSLLDGAFGKEIREHISDDPMPHFVLGKGERCPFLNEKGLCRIILALGEDALCEICKEHPRFYNSFPGREEKGLGLCCEEAVRLLLSEDVFSLICEDDGGHEELDPFVEELAQVRDEIIAVMCERTKPFTERLSSAFERLGGMAPAFDGKEWAGIFLSLERMDERWTEMLRLLRSRESETEPELADPRYEKFFCYLLYRHFITAENREEQLDRLFFCTIGTMLVASLDLAEPELRDEHIRLFSAEIEYSDENVEKICALRRQQFDFRQEI